MDKRVKYSLKQKLSVVKSIHAGQESCGSAAVKIGSKDTTVRRWYSLYKQHGGAGLKLRHGSYKGEFKIRVVRHLLKNQLSLRQAAALFGIPKDHTVGLWLRKYESEGAAGLLKEPGGRKKSLMTKKSKNKNKTPLTPEQKLAALQAENEYLRAENAFLKKLDALIQEEKAAKLQNKRPKPSKN